MSNTLWNPALYDTQHDFVSAYGRDLLPLLDAKAGERILDLGCGTGTLTHEIAATGAEVVGIDYSPAMINKALEKYPKLNFKIADGQDFYFDVHFDAVFSNAALHWMPQPEKVINCVAQALKHKGRFVLEMGARGNLQQLLSAINQATTEFDIGKLDLVNYYPSLAEYASLLEKYGFQIQYAVTFNRATLLKGKDGLRNWVKEFRTKITEKIVSEEQEIFFKRLESITSVYSELYHDDAWWADYVRLRIIAIRL